MSFSERFARKETMALKRLGDPAVYLKAGLEPVDTFVIVDEDVEIQSEVGIEKVTQITLSSVTHTNIQRHDEVICLNKTYRLNRKMNTDGSLITFTALEV